MTEVDRFGMLRWLYVIINVLLIFISAPLIAGDIEPNRVYGFRTAATLSDSELWYSANAFMGWAIAIAAGISSALIAVRPAVFRKLRGEVTIVLVDLSMFVVPLLIAVIASFLFLSAAA